MRTTLYKLTDENGQTRNNTQWGENVTHVATGETNQPLCSDAYIHAYESPLLAIFLNPIHAGFKQPRLWEAAGEVSKRDGLKCGCRELTTLREIPLPEITTTQRIAFAILCAKCVCFDVEWNKWADNWLYGKNRSGTARAETEASEASEASEAAAWAAWAAWAAAWLMRTTAQPLLLSQQLTGG